MTPTASAPVTSEMYGLGDKLKAAGQAAVLAADQGWKDRALLALSRFVEQRIEWYGKSNADFTMDQFRSQCSTYVGDPRHDNAWGALPRMALARGIIAATSQWRKAARPEAHSRMVRVWAPA